MQYKALCPFTCSFTCRIQQSLPPLPPSPSCLSVLPPFRSQSFCKANCSVDLVPISNYFDEWLLVSRPRREDTKGFPRIYLGQSSYEVLTAFVNARKVCPHFWC